MPDDFNYNPDNLSPDENNDDDDPNSSASAIFIEMMRQAAAKRGEVADASAQSRVTEDWQTETPLPTHQPETIGYPPPPINPPARPANHELEPDLIPSDEPEANNVQITDDADTEKRAALMEAHRIRRLKRRRARRKQRTVGTISSFIRTMIVTFLAAGLASTIFTWFTDPSFIGQGVVSGLQIAAATVQATEQPTAIPTPNWARRIGVVSGHRGPENDPGAVCEDGLTETEINFDIAQRVVRNLRQLGYSVDLLDEFDPRLTDYQAAALVSIHANTCEDFGEFVSGFLVAKADARPEGGPDSILAECLAIHYGQASELERRFTLTLDMTDYHNFREIHSLTPAAILELGFMKDDRALLTGEPDKLARGITDGILCFLQPGPDGLPQPVATPTQTPIPLDS